MISYIRTLCCNCFVSRSNTTVANPVSTMPVSPNIEMNYLEYIEYKDTIPFVPPITEGKVIKVYDGDTITIASKMPYPNSPIFRFSVRFLGIDSPEIKAKTQIEKSLAVISRDALAEKISGKRVVLKNVSLEKYGRLLADVYLDDLHLNQWMLNNKYAIPYDGGTKNRPDEWNDNV